LAHLKSLPKLQFLFLQNARLTDRGLDELSQLKHIDSLYLEGNSLSDEAVGKALPGWHVHW
jgi:hypothetical protein